MVLKGQFLERPTLIPTTGGLVLEALSHRGALRPGLLILPPPPLEGSGMDDVLAAELAFAASHLGFPTLRFNYRGVGGSQGARTTRPDQLDELLADARAAFELAADNAPGPAPAVASIGASDAVALRLVTERRATGLALVSPRLVRAEDLTGLALPSVVVTDVGALPTVGKAVASLLLKLSAAIASNP